MDRKGIIAVSAAILILILWQIEFAPKYAPPTPPPGQAAAGSPAPSASAPAAAPGNTPAITAAPAPSAAPAEPKVPEQLLDADGPSARYHFTNLGGGIAKAELTGYPAESASNVDLNQFGSQPIGALTEQPGQGGDLPYTVTRQGESVLCVRDQPGGLSISKKFTLPASLQDAHGFLVTLDVTFANHGAQPVQSGGYYLYVGSAAPIHQRDLPLYTAFDWLVQGGKNTHIDVNWFSAGKIPFIGLETHPERPVYTVDADKIGWASINSQFFTTVVAPQNGATGSGVWAHRFPVQTDTRQIIALEGALRLPAFTLPPGRP